MTSVSVVFDVRDVVVVFNACFERSCRTKLESGAQEPLYQPAAQAGDCHIIYSTQDYFASALHEISHWCIAGEKRRLLMDYGYWYEPDGRSAEQQAEFERVEVKPQALEWIFAQCCGAPFRISADNLSGDGAGASDAFKASVVEAARGYVANGLPARAAQFAQALGRFYRGDDWTPEQLSSSEFALSCLC